MARLATALGAYRKNPAIKKPLAKPPTGLGAAALKPAKPAMAPAPAPAPPAPAAPSPLPWDANYETRIGAIGRDESNANAGLLKEEGDVKQAYGFDDVSNPFNRLKMLQEAFANQQRGTTNSMAARGNLYSSAIETQRGDDQHRQDINYDSLRRDYDSELSGITARRTAVKTGAEDATTDAGWERTQTALANRPDPASVPAAPAPAKDYVEKRDDAKGGTYHIYPKSAKYPNGRRVFVKD